MWKRTNVQDCQQKTTIDNPSLIETSIDEETLRITRDISNGSFSISSRPAFGTKRTEDVIKGLPVLPFNSLQISSVNRGRPLSSDIATTSSIYSQSSPEMNFIMPPGRDHPPRSSSLYPDDVSPPESIHMAKEGNRTRSSNASPDVSPVSDSPTPLKGRSPTIPSTRFNSNIPIVKKTRKFWNRPSSSSPDQGSPLTHWDVYSGEPTTREKGKPPSTTPSAVKVRAEPAASISNVHNFGTSTHISSGNTIGRKRVASRDNNRIPIIRPEWKGAGGRHKIVNPLLDKPLPPGKSPTFPAGSEKDQGERKERDIETTAEVTDISPTSGHWASNYNGPSSQLNDSLRIRTPDNHSGIFDNGTNSFPSGLAAQVDYPNTPICGSGLALDDNRSPLARNPSNEYIEGRRSNLTSEVTGNILPDESQQEVRERIPTFSEGIPSFTPSVDTKRLDSNAIENRFRANLQDMNLRDQLSSRFSATTYATTTCDSPPATPDLTSQSSAISTTPNSILNRRRPIAQSGMTNSRVANRKALPSDMSTSMQVAESKRKSLPKSPPETQAVSRVAGLEAKVDNLRRRRVNLQTVIHELTNVIQPSSIAYDMASRQEIKRTVEGLREELAEVIRDEHETGLKLHRALKRDDEFAAYEPTSIWIRRVTS